ncbi:cytochrome P450 [Modestobacter sp. I12A-02628]|uniref:Cytochrome P450 n=1 Tax=Goekera deserti TaxID=2497753 RepID=A0A7K3WCX9_9ACTN|nr:cytochrome P450 [Goekera deserti]MPQ97036.1 cytochrome P450 [Goekera deserti]NDI46648.1 cytochrome P450 [Goekera deserti]NEL54217.1 cytochrome P450 [Goekera deserti]
MSSTREIHTPAQQTSVVNPRGPRSMLFWALRHGLPRLVVGQGVKRGDVQARLIGDPAAHHDPFPLHAEVRAMGPLVRGRLTYMTATHSVVKEVLRSSSFGVKRDGSELPQALGAMLRWSGQGGPPHPIQPPSLLAVEGAEHTRYRRLVSSVFTARAIGRLRGQVQAVADELLDELAAGPSEVDLVAAYAARLPLTVIADILGVPASEHAQVLDFGSRVVSSLDIAVTWPEFRETQLALAEFEVWVGNHLDRLRRDPGDDLLSQLVVANEGGQGLTERELRSLAGLLLAAGFETTVNLLGSGTRLLLQNPDQLERLRADETLWPTAVDECLRLESPVQTTDRTALQHTELAGMRVGKDAHVVLFLGGANRDPAVFPDPDTLDVGRPNAADHLSFSGGPHFCLGAALAKLEGEIGLKSLFTRFPDLALAPGAHRRETRVLRGYDRLPVRLGTPA